MTVPLRAALYLRVSTARQAEHDVSIPDQKRQGEAYCAARGYQLVETYVESGASATNDRRPEFQRMIEAGTSRPAPFDIVIVHRAPLASRRRACVIARPTMTTRRGSNDGTVGIEQRGAERTL